MNISRKKGLHYISTTTFRQTNKPTNSFAIFRERPIKIRKTTDKHIHIPDLQKHFLHKGLVVTVLTQFLSPG